MLIGQVQLLAQDIDPADAAAGAAAGAAVAGVGMMMVLAQLGLALALVVAQWKVFSKAGKPGWAAFVPIYNIVVMLEIVGRPISWIFFFFICALINFFLIKNSINCNSSLTCLSISNN